MDMSTQFKENLETLKLAVKKWREPKEMALLQRIEAIQLEKNIELESAKAELAKLRHLNLMQAAEIMGYDSPELLEPYETRRMLYDRIFSERARGREVLMLIKKRLNVLVYVYQKDNSAYGNSWLGLVFSAFLTLLMFFSWVLFDTRFDRMISDLIPGLITFSILIFYWLFIFFTKRISLKRHYAELRWWQSQLVLARYRMVIKHPDEYRAIAIVPNTDSRGEDVSLKNGPFYSTNQFI